MRAKLTLCSALAVVLVSATAGLAQTAQYDRSADHMWSYGPAYVDHSARVVRQPPVHTPRYLTTPITDRTADHMFYYGPIH